MSDEHVYASGILNHPGNSVCTPDLIVTVIKGVVHCQQIGPVRTTSISVYGDGSTSAYSSLLRTNAASSWDSRSSPLFLPRPFAWKPAYSVEADNGGTVGTVESCLLPRIMRV